MSTLWAFLIEIKQNKNKTKQKKQNKTKNQKQKQKQKQKKNLCAAITHHCKQHLRSCVIIGEKTKQKQNKTKQKTIMKVHCAEDRGILVEYDNKFWAYTLIFSSNMSISHATNRLQIMSWQNICIQ